MKKSTLSPEMFSTEKLKSHSRGKGSLQECMKGQGSGVTFTFLVLGAGTKRVIHGAR